MVWEAIDYNDLHSDIPLTKSLSRVDRCFTDRKDNDVWGDWMRKPFISLSKDVSELDPAWTTCSGVAIGAMDPPRALVPTAGFEDSPSANPITQSSPGLPAATPGKTVPDPISRPTSKPSKESSPKVTAQPEPPNNCLTAPDDDPRDLSPNPAVASAVVKEPSKSPEVAAPRPQQPSPDRPLAHQGDNFGPPPAAEKETTLAEKSSGQQQLEHISSALFPDRPIGFASDKTGSGSTSQGQPVETAGQPSLPSVGASDGLDREPDDGLPPRPDRIKQGSEDNAPGMENLPSQHTSGNADSPAIDSRPPIYTDGDTAGLVIPSNDGISLAAEGQGSKGSKAKAKSGDLPQPQEGNPPAASTGKSGSQQEAAELSPQSDINPKTFAFVSNLPPMVGSPTVGRASEGAAIIMGTATIHPGKAQAVDGITISPAPDALVVGTSTSGFVPPLLPSSAAPPPRLRQEPNGGLVIGIKTLLPGQKDSINGHDVSNGSSNILIDEKNFALPAVTPPLSILNLAGLGIAQAPENNGVVLDGQTYQPGAHLTRNGHTFSIALGNAIIVDGTTRTLPMVLPPTPLLIDTTPIRKDSNGNIIIGSQTLAPGSQTTIRFCWSCTVLVI